MRKCEICGEEFGSKYTGRHLLIHHNMAYMEYVNLYKEEFPKYKKCQMCDKYSWGKNCSRKCFAEWKTIHYIGRTGWSKGLTKDTHSGLKAMGEKASIRNKGRNSWLHMDDETSRLAKKKISEATRLRCTGEGNPMYGKTHTPEVIQKIFKNRFMNNLEQMVADYLKLMNVEYYFQFFISGESTYSYDFKLKGKNIIIEIDGDYWHGGPSISKYSPFIEETRINDINKDNFAKENGYELYRFWESELKADITILNSILNIK